MTFTFPEILLILLQHFYGENFMSSWKIKVAALQWPERVYERPLAVSSWYDDVLATTYFTLSAGIMLFVGAHVTLFAAIAAGLTAVACVYAGHRFMRTGLKLDFTKTPLVENDVLELERRALQAQLASMDVKKNIVVVMGQDPARGNTLFGSSWFAQDMGKLLGTAMEGYQTDNEIVVSFDKEELQLHSSDELKALMASKIAGAISVNLHYEAATKFMRVFSRTMALFSGSLPLLLSSLAANSLTHKSYKRSRFFLADRGGVAMDRNPAAAARALRRLQRLVYRRHCKVFPRLMDSSEGGVADRKFLRQMLRSSPVTQFIVGRPDPVRRHRRFEAMQRQLMRMEV